MKRFYETTAFTDDGREWTIISIPATQIALMRAYPANDATGQVAELIRQFVTTRRPKVLAIAHREAFEGRPHIPAFIGADGRIHQIPDALIKERFVAIEQSPLSGMSIGEILKSAGGTAVGTIMGVQLSGGDALLTFITVPLGVIIMGGTLGISSGVRKALHDLVLKLFGVEPGKPNPKKRSGARSRGQARGESVTLRKSTVRKRR